MRADQYQEFLVVCCEAGLSIETVTRLLDIVSKPSPGALRQRRWRDATRDVTETSRVSDAVSRDVPVYLKEESKKERKKDTAPRGARLPDDWEPLDETCEWARTETGWDDATLSRHLDEFCDYWHSLPGAKATKIDWDKTFKNRIRELRAREMKVNGFGSKPSVQKYQPGERFRSSSGNLY